MSVHSVLEGHPEDDLLIFDERWNVHGGDFLLVLLGEEPALFGSHSRLLLGHAVKSAFKSDDVI